MVPLTFASRVEISEFKEKVTYLTPPHAPALVSTLSPAGNSNLAPFEQVMVCSEFPPRFALAITPDTDTLKNLVEVCDELVIGFPTPSIANEVYACGYQLDRSESEFDLSRLTPVPSKLIRPPRIAECQVNFECKLCWIKEAGDHELVVVTVLLADVRNDLFKPDKVARRCGLDPLYYATSGNFFTKGRQLKAQKEEIINNYRNSKKR